MVSVAASLVDKDLRVVHGMVANLSELGASVLTCRGVDDGSYVALELSREDRGLVETVARVVWTWNGVAAASEASGSLVGLSFCGLSATERAHVWMCSASVARAAHQPGPVPFPFDQLSEPEVDWFLSREVEGRKATERRKLRPRRRSPTPPSRR